MHPTLTIAVKAARRAGSLINRASFDLDKLTVTRKQDKDFVSEVDHAAEDAIISIIRESFPSHSFLGEESGLTEGAPDEMQWIIDPLDGTTNFLHGFPQYCVSIGAVQKNVLQHAVIYDPVRNELFTASRGGGAFLNDKRIRVSKRRELSESLIGTGFPFRQGDDFPAYLAQFEAVSRAAAGLRRPGSAALDLAYVACGRLDGFWEMGLSPWDMAAGCLLIQEAGGLVTDFGGGSNYLEDGKVVAATPKIFTQLLRLVAPQARSPA